MSKFSDFKATAEEEAKSKREKLIKSSESSLKNCDDSTKVFSYTLQEGVGNFVKEESKKTPLKKASAVMNDFIKNEFENYLKTKWNV